MNTAEMKERILANSMKISRIEDKLRRIEIITWYVAGALSLQIPKMIPSFFMS